MSTLSANTMSNVLPFAAIRATQIARMSEQHIGDFQLTADAVEQLADDDVGVLIGNCGSMGRIHDKLRDLSATDYPAVFVVIMQSKKMAAIWYNEQAELLERKPVAAANVPVFWTKGCCVFTTIEGLQSLSDSGQLTKPVAAMLMVDPYMTTHECRGYGNNRWSQAHDRPQLVLNFRTEQMEHGRLPPLLFFTVPPAKSLNTKPAESVYGLATWWYCDGRYLRVGRPPVV